MPLKNLSVYTILIFLPFYSLAQLTNTSWASHFGSVSADAGTGIKVDQSGDVITIGWFRGTVDFDPGPNEYTLTSKGSTDVFIIKVTADGKLVWARSFGGKQLDQAQKICLDQEDNIYITGNFQDEINLEPLLNVKLIAQGFKDAFVVKFNAKGDLIWANQMNGKLDEYGKSISADKLGNVFVSGYFQSNFEINTVNGISALNSKGGDDIFIAKLNNEGEFLWSIGLGGRLDDIPTSIVNDEENNILVYGNFNDTIDIAPGPPRKVLQEKGNGDAFILKLDNEGEFQWVDQLSGSSVVGASELITDQTGNIFATGTFREEADFDPGNAVFNLTAPGIYGDAFILKLNKNGEFVWVKQLGGTQQDDGLAIAIDKVGNIYTTGCYQFKADFDPGSGEYFLYSDSTNNNDIYISKLDASGNFVFARGMNGKQSDIGYSIATNKNNLIYTTGIFGSTVNFNTGGNDYRLISNGLEDAFVHCLIQNYLSVDNVDDLSWIEVYPNPCEEELNIIFTNKVQEVLEANLYNVQGQMVLNFFGQHVNQDIGRMVISTHNLMSGMYCLKIRTVKEILSKSIVVKY